MTMNVVSGRLRLGLSAAVAAGAFVLALMPVTAARAATPVHFSFTQPIFIIDNTSCTFPITVSGQARITGTAFFDAQGNFQNAIIHSDGAATDSANGITLTENDHFTDFINSVGYDKETGTPIHIQDGGLVIRDAGYILFNPDGSVAILHGPHPQLEGDTAALCAALS
jgi:hypothetical protein